MIQFMDEWQADEEKEPECGFGLQGTNVLLTRRKFDIFICKYGRVISVLKRI